MAIWRVTIENLEGKAETTISEGDGLIVGVYKNAPEGDDDTVQALICGFGPAGVENLGDVTGHLVQHVLIRIKEFVDEIGEWAEVQDIPEEEREKIFRAMAAMAAKATMSITRPVNEILLKVAEKAAHRAIMDDPEMGHRPARGKGH